MKFAGMAAPADTAKYCRLGDIFVCASTSETQGLTYIEAMASGLPLVCRKDPCLYGVLEEGGNGYSYEGLNEFAEAVSRMIREPVWMERAAEHSMENAKQFGTGQFGKKVINIYSRRNYGEERMREMKVLLYAKNEKIVSKSGIGRAMLMQKNSLKAERVELTFDPQDDFDIVHLNTVFPSDYRMAKRAKRAGKKVVYHAHSTKEDFQNSFTGSDLAAPLF